ncbi:MAG TPA: Crp/Fnr family transcriptional regulator [Treponemataceae bacterium]|jgi:CRP/FNR family transcriptional regulator|nr:Crp/Fnr family transcriptional regulator [Treponemataceae bacterium]
MNREKIKEQLSEHFSAWEELTETEQEDLLANSQLIEYKKGVNVHGGDTSCAGLIFILDGSLRTYMLSEEGREITLYRLRHGDICILSASCVISTITFEVHIDAEEDTKALLVSSSHFSDLFEANKNIQCFSYKLATERFSDVMWAMQQILFMSMDKRLAIFLWDEIASQSAQERPKLHYTHEQIAKYTGSAREVISRMLKYFSDEGIVTVSRGDITIINKPKLRSIIA